MHLYYQISGRSGSHAHNIGLRDASQTARSLFKFWRSDTPLELILGMKAGGSTYILIPCDEWTRRFKLRPPTLPPHQPDAFLSRSPIYFHTETDLFNKLLTYSPKKSKSKRNDEISEANPLGLFSTELDNTSPRVSFEHSRMLWRLLTDPSHTKLSRYDLPDRQLHSSAVIICLAANSWMSESRDTREVVLDVAWNVIGPEELLNEAKLTKIKHFIVDENQILCHCNGQERGHFRFGESTIAPLSVVTQEIQKLFDNAPAHTVVVLSNYELYMKDVMIQGLGLESSNWEIGLSGLLGFSQVGIKSVVDQKHGK
ncbi:hypothetical protein SISSUDRAFT_591302 [Sistotremastrum suecicum HHB10207 ss-3]|uniref:Uncharacterized protein n=1 Tax=Sistotremastrum suecicum HHB10207 ss-3 TaxID=1314776 RepID=A0A166EMJ6_9AGAM|nr:hypothetical protein SISSUDRAFT_591302 [Sistotremastrum suecicum HHB10207 ss-3]